jgi:hypothetical protein
MGTSRSELEIRISKDPKFAKAIASAFREGKRLLFGDSRTAQHKHRKDARQAIFEWRTLGFVPRKCAAALLSRDPDVFRYLGNDAKFKLEGHGRSVKQSDLSSDEGGSESSEEEAEDAPVDMPEIGISGSRDFSNSEHPGFLSTADRRKELAATLANLDSTDSPPTLRKFLRFWAHRYGVTQEAMSALLFYIKSIKKIPEAQIKECPWKGAALSAVSLISLSNLYIIGEPMKNNIICHLCIDSF